MTKKEAIELLKIPEKTFDNYFKYSKEIKSVKIKNRWNFNKKELEKYINLKNNRTVDISIEEYEKCLDFGLNMAYNIKNTSGTGIRGVRSKMQTADDFTFGIIAEIGFQKFLKQKFNIEVNLDLEVHSEKITPQDIISITENGIERKSKFNIAIKSSKLKSCFNVISQLEFEDTKRKSDYYVFIRVNLPDDHIFSFFNERHKVFKKSKFEKQISKLNEIQVWICGYSIDTDFNKVKEIPGQKFDNGYRYVVSTANMKNSEKDWENFINKI
jgi:hypothetical protein